MTAFFGGNEASEAQTELLKIESLEFTVEYSDKHWSTLV